MKQLYDMGVRGFWFTAAQFIPTKNNIQDAKVEDGGEGAFYIFLKKNKNL